MNRRLKLHEKLVEILGSTNVYFQPPPTVIMKYPCIVYALRGGDTEYADNQPYRFVKRFDVTYITTDPDNDTVEQIAYSFPMCRMDRGFTSNNLYHYVFSLYF